MSALLPSIAALGLAALYAGWLAYARPSGSALGTQRAAATPVYLLVTVVQAVHFAEEAVTGFNIAFPGLFGLPPIPMWLFVAFNLGWLAVWATTVRALGQARRFAFFAAWFLAIAAAMNGVAHPAFAAVERGYFPGLVTAPFIGAGGVWLLMRLRAATSGAATRS